MYPPVEWSNREMPSYTTVTVNPERAEGLRNFRDEHGFPSMDAALQELLRQKST